MLDDLNLGQLSQELTHFCPAEVSMPLDSKAPGELQAKLREQETIMRPL